MKKLIYPFVILGAVALAGAPAMTDASTIAFTQSLAYGTSGTAVMQLQKFLFNEGYLKAAPTGNFFSLTQAALKAFQKDQGIAQTGSFDGLTMANANARIQVAFNKPAAQVAVKSISNSSQTASALGAISKTIAWQSSGFPAGTGVNINLIRKTSDSPISYTLVKKIAQNIPNSGTYEWVPAYGDVGAKMYIEVTCAGVSASSACQTASTPIATQ